MEVDANEVARVVLQFLQESGLEKSARALEAEANVRLNVVQNVAEIGAMIEARDWAGALAGLRKCQLPRGVMWTLYEEILGDLVDRDEESAAKEILRDSEDLEELKKDNGMRFDEIQDLVHNRHSAARRRRSGLDERARERARKALSRSVCACLTEAGPSQLLQLLGQALAFRGELALDDVEAKDREGGRKESRKRKRRAPSLFSQAQETLAAQLKRARKRGAVLDDDGAQVGGTPARALEVYGRIAMGDDVTLNASCISWDGRSIVTGTADGFIEVWDLASGALRKDLAYQRANDIMMHKKAILGLDLSQNDGLLASSSLDGTVAVWDLIKGKRLTRIKRAHGKVAVNCVRFSPSAKRLATGGGDHAVRIFSVETGNVVQTLYGPQAQVNAVCFFGGEAGDKYVAAGSSDHKVVVWDARSAQVVIEFTLDAPVSGLEASDWGSGRTALLVVVQTSKLSVLVGAPASSGPGQPIFERVDLACPNAQTRFVAGGCAQDGPSRICAAAEDGQLYLYDWARVAKTVDLATVDAAQVRASAPAAEAIPLSEEGQPLEILGLAHSPKLQSGRLAALLAGGEVNLLRQSSK